MLCARQGGGLPASIMLIRAALNAFTSRWGRGGVHYDNLERQLCLKAALGKLGLLVA